MQEPWYQKNTSQKASEIVSSIGHYESKRLAYELLAMVDPQLQADATFFPVSLNKISLRILFVQPQPLHVQQPFAQVCARSEIGCAYNARRFFISRNLSTVASDERARKIKRR